MKDKIIKLNLNRKITKLQKHMKKQGKQINIILDKLDQMKLIVKEVIVKKKVYI